MRQVFIDGKDRAWPVIKKKILSKQQLFLFLDFDGTLSPIVGHPSKARLSLRLHKQLLELQKMSHVRLGFISGRLLKEVKNLVRIPGAFYAGNHGFELCGPSWRWSHPAHRMMKGFIRESKKVLRPIISKYPGSFLEDKSATLSIHYRKIEAHKTALFCREIKARLKTIKGFFKIRVIKGKKVIELMPRVLWHKGKALEKIIYQSRTKPVQTCYIYIGDDTTDEDAFCVINRKGGISIHVHDETQKTKAKYTIRHQSEVKRLLNRITQAIT